MLYLKYPNIIHTYDLEFFKVVFLQIIYIYIYWKQLSKRKIFKLKYIIYF